MGRRFFYGWILVAASAVGIGCSCSLLILTLTGIFAGPIGAEMGWSVQQLLLGSSLAGVSGILSAPFIGAISDRFGVRPTLAVSFIIEALILASFKFLDTEIAGYLARYLALALLCMGTTQVVFSRVVSAWFNRRLGLALGVSLAGVGLGGAFWSLTAQRLIDVYGWRDAYVAIGAIIAFIVLPLLLLLIRDTPTDMNLNVDGDHLVHSSNELAKKTHSGMTLREAAGTQQYWLMITVFFLIGLSLQSVQLHLVPLLISRGNSPQLASAVQASLWMMVVIGRISSGLFLDRVFAARVAQVYLLAPIIGISALTLGISGDWAFAAAICVGLAVGGESDVVAYLVRRYFGLKHYSRIYGTFFSVYGAASAFGPSLTAWGVEHVAGGYSSVFWVHVALLLVAVGLLFFYKPYSRDSYTS